MAKLLEAIYKKKHNQRRQTHQQTVAKSKSPIF